MKKKMVIKVSMNDQKLRSKAMKIAVGVLGVESVALKGEDMSQIEVTGDGVDAVALMTLLRKKVGYAGLVSMDAADGDNNTEENEAKVEQLVWPPNYYHVANVVPHYNVHVVRDYDPYNCSIL